jgi:hypothetical protein
MKLAKTAIHALLLLSVLPAVTPLQGIPNGRSSSSSSKHFDQFQACAGQDGLVLSSDADVGADHLDGWFAYSGSLIFCCAGLPYAVTCSEMMLGYCRCPAVETTTNDYDYITNIVCYARTCGSQVVATPILNGTCWLR